jgi:hypothetical protein
MLYILKKIRLKTKHFEEEKGLGKTYSGGEAQERPLGSGARALESFPCMATRTK